MPASSDSFTQQVLSVARQGQLREVQVEFGDPDQCRQAGGKADRSESNGPEFLPESLPDRCFLTASLTKPIVAMALLKLAGDGEVSLTERLGDVLPDFHKAAFRRITLRHLLTHTSGFADMLPQNAELRAAQAPLSEFLKCARDAEPEFAPDSDCRYSSIGFLLIGAVIEQISGTSLSEFLDQMFFQPLQMQSTRLGSGADFGAGCCSEVAKCELPVWQANAGNWGWNSSYWQNLGAPWGGLISSAADLGIYCRMLLNDGRTSGGHRILSPAVIRAAFSDQTREVFGAAGYQGSRRGWGLGWRLQWPGHQASFGDFVSSKTVGHWGATGTLFWIDPEVRRYAVILTTTPYEVSGSAIQRISNAAVAS
ncbi:MAG: serine hydrolase domain-containing protein [Planctomycetaceae bacterium]